MNLMKNQKNPEIHIGEVICAQLAKDGRSKKWLAEQVHYEHSYLCKILKKQHINTDLLLRISRALQYDFFAIFSKYLREMVNFDHDIRQ